MYSSLSTRRRILLALLILGGKSTYSVARSFLPIDYDGPKFYGMLKRLEREGLIRRSNRRQATSDKPIVRLLPAGITLLESRYGPRLENFFRSLLAKPGDSWLKTNDSAVRNWSLVILNFPTDQAYSRSRLAGRLTELGCGMLRDGVYVSPYPILPSVAQWAEENDCLNNVFLLPITNYQLPITNLSSAWDLPVLSRRYLSLLDRLTIAKGISLPAKRDRAVARIKADFLDTLISDPLLPLALLPPGWPLATVIKAVKELSFIYPLFSSS